METTKKRVPFKPSEGDAPKDDVSPVLDEQEQDELIQELKVNNETTSKRFLSVLHVILVLSFILQIVSLFKNPFLLVGPSTGPKPVEIPLPIPFTLLNMAIHLNLGVVAFRDELRSRYQISEIALHQPLPWQVAYAVAAVPPTLSMFLQQAWQATAWWGITMLVVFVVHTVTASIGEGDKSISELESLRYVARGA